MFIRALGSELQEIAEAELNEIPSRIPEDLKYIREWLNHQPHIKARTDDQWLIAFLRGCKFSLQRTKEKLDYFYTVRSLVPELFSNRDPLLPEIQEILKSGVLIPTTATTADTRIVIVRWSACNVNKISFLNLIKTYFMIMDVFMMEDDNCMVIGHQVLGDYKGFPLSLALQFGLILCWENAYPVRIKGLHSINVPTGIDHVFNLTKSLLNRKMKERLHVFTENNSNEVYKFIPKTLLPKEYGGDNSSVVEITEKWKKKVESYRDWFLDDVNYCTNEQFRPGKPRTSADVFGVEGTFRKLTVD